MMILFDLKIAMIHKPLNFYIRENSQIIISDFGYQTHKREQKWQSLTVSIEEHISSKHHQ
jgi:hypothetical protein